MGRVVSRDQLKKIIKEEKARGKKIAFTNGCFDLLHLGHIRYLQEARKQGDFLIVALNSDLSVRKLKGKERPIVSSEERAEVLAALESVDYVVIFSEDTPARLINLLEPDVLIKGGDYRKEKIVGRETVESRGGKVVTIPLVEGCSTHGLLKKIRGE